MNIAENLVRQIEPAEQTPLPLENGDRMTRLEFERRYAAMPHVKRAELIEGVVYMPSPVHFKTHSEPHASIIGWLAIYCAATPGVSVGDNATVRLDIDNEPQPDALLRLEPALGGNSRLSSDDYIEGPPELIVEIAGSSVSYDLHDKLHVYRRSGVQEYIVWRVYEAAIDWFQLSEGQYRPLSPTPDGVIHSRVFPGLQLAVEALLAGDLAGVLAEAQRGLATAAHTGFVEKITNYSS